MAPPNCRGGVPDNSQSCLQNTFQENKRLKDNEIEIIQRISKLPTLCAQQLAQHQVRTRPLLCRRCSVLNTPKLSCRADGHAFYCSQARSDGAVNAAASRLDADVRQLAADIDGQIKCYTEAMLGLERQVLHSMGFYHHLVRCSEIRPLTTAPLVIAFYF